MRNIAIVFGRKNSKGLKNKNIRKKNNKTLIYFPINSAKKSKVGRASQNSGR